jgi:hypothetical protein
MTRRLQRHRYLADFALASLARRRFRTATVVLVYASVVALLASVMLYAQAVRREAAQTLRNAPAVVVQRMLAGRQQPAPASYVEALARLRGVQSAQGRLWGDYFDPSVRATCMVMVPPVGGPYHVLTGETRVGAAIARSFGVQEGETLALVTTAESLLTPRITQVLPAESEGLTADIILLSADDFRTLFGYPDGVITDVALEVANPSEHRVVAAKALARLKDVRTIVREDVAHTYEAIFSWREGLVLAVFLSVLGAFVLFAFDRASGLSSGEAREIAILRAIGWDASDVLLMRFWEGFAISATAFCAGYLGAYLLVFYLPASPFDTALRGWTAVRPHVRLTPDTDPLEVAALFLLTVVPYAAAVLVPAWRAAVSDPDTVIRG